MKSYFQNFPKIEYETPFGKVSSSDLMTRFKFLDSIQGDPFSTYDYNVRDGDRPDIIAMRYYKNADLAWIVMLSSDLFSVKDSFPLSDDELNAYIEYTYGITLNESYSQVHHYEDEDGYAIDYDTFIFSSGSIVYVYDYETKRNNDKRKLKLISNRYVKQITDELEAHLIAVKKER